MKRKIWTSFVVIIAVAGLLMTASCAKRELTPDDVKKKTSPDSASYSAEKKVQVKEDGVQEKDLYGDTMEKAIENFMNEEIYFAYDSSVIQKKYVSVLKKKAQWIRANNSVSITLEGHCDERGTEAYNLALGDRRAENVKRFLTDSGICERRITTISYGEELPVDTRSTESAWVKNRRVHFILK